MNKVPISEARAKDFKNPDNDSRGPWASVDLTGQTGHATKEQYYEITLPSGKKIRPPEGRCWAISQDTFQKLRDDNRIWFGKNGNARPRQKQFISEKEGITAWTWWPNTEVGHSQEATKELAEILGNTTTFNNPKPLRLIDRIIQIATSPGDVVMDSFAGSGTTGHSVLRANKGAPTDRKFILIEMEQHIAQNH